MEKILITGGTGLVGKALQNLLIKNGYIVHILTRSPKLANEFKWDINKRYIDEKAFEEVSYIVHLAGAGIADKRWTQDRKKVILDSRVESTNLLLEKVSALKVPIKKFICASATGYYGAITSDKIFTEKDEPAEDFLGSICRKWEDAAHQFKKLNVPVTILRTGIVLSNKGGALAKMKTPIISPLGSGNQYLPWIHMTDLCNLYLNAITKESFTGIYNAVTNDNQTSKTFARKLAKSVGRIYVPIAVPAVLLKLVFGEMAIILLEGSRVSANKVLKSSFQYQYPTLESAFKNLHQ